MDPDEGHARFGEERRRLPAVSAYLMGRRVPLFPLFLALCAPPVHAQRLADSAADFSGQQGDGGWRYGIIQGDAGSQPAYSVAAFEEFDVWNGSEWRASAALVGSQNTGYLRVDRWGGHPCGLGPGAQNQIIWATRRYVSQRTGFVSIVYEVESYNVTANGTGITARLWVDGTELRTHGLRNSGSTLSAPPVITWLDAGSIVDFAIDPLGVPPYPENASSARGDGSGFQASIFAYPCSSNADCAGISCIAQVCCNPAVHACPDAGVPDSGALDAGVTDAAVDAGVVDAGDPIGSGEADAGRPLKPPHFTVGCDCSAVPFATPWLLLMALMVRRARR